MARGVTSGLSMVDWYIAGPATSPHAPAVPVTTESRPACRSSEGNDEFDFTLLFEQSALTLTTQPQDPVKLPGTIQTNHPEQEQRRASGRGYE
jgi:hypothetical protein